MTCSTPNLDLKIQLRAPYVAPLNIMQCMCLKALRLHQATGAIPGEKGMCINTQICIFFAVVHVDWARKFATKRAPGLDASCHVTLTTSMQFQALLECQQGSLFVLRMSLGGSL
jgi:hypothetical protein